MKPHQRRGGLRRQVAALARQIQNQAHLNHILNTIPNIEKRRQFFMTIQPLLRFKAQYPAEVQE